MKQWPFCILKSGQRVSPWSVRWLVGGWAGLEVSVKMRGLCWGTWSCDTGPGFGPGSMGVLLNWVQNPYSTLLLDVCHFHLFPIRRA